MEVDLKRKRRSGCLGCLTQVSLALLLGGAVLYVVYMVIAPWGFYMGGNFHVFPMWQGWGPMHAPAGDYLLYVQMQPRTRTRYSRGVAGVDGNAVLCTPRGETFKMRLGGDFEKNMGASTDGKRVYLWLYTRPSAFSSSANDHPRFDLHGVWHNPDIVLDDHGTLSREFHDDGTFNPVNANRRPASKTPFTLTLKEGTYSAFESACKAARKQ